MVNLDKALSMIFILRVNVDLNMHYVTLKSMKITLDVKQLIKSTQKKPKGFVGGNK